MLQHPAPFSQYLATKGIYAMSLTKVWLVPQAETQTNPLARARSGISFASRVVNQDRPLDGEDREAIARALHNAKHHLDAVEENALPGAVAA